MGRMGTLAAFILVVGASSGAVLAQDQSVAPASAAPGAALRVGFLFPDTQGFYAGVIKGVTDGAAAAGRAVDLVQTNAEDDATKEAAFMDTLIASKVDAILTSAVSGDASVSSIKAAVEAGIPVICYNTCINVDDMKTYVSAYAFGDPVEFGYKLGTSAVDYFKAQGITEPKIGILNCEFVEVCVNRREGFEKALTEAGLNYTIVANQQATDAVLSIQTAQDMLTANPDINALMGESGGASIGAVKAIEAAGLAGKVAAFGSDMTTDLANALNDNSILKGDVDVSGQAVGHEAIQAVLDTLAGNQPADIIVPVPVDLYTTPEQAQAWLAAHADGIP